MKNRFLLFLIILLHISIFGCEKNNPENEVLPKQLSFSNSDSRSFWSPDGQYIAFLSYRNTYDSMSSAILSEIWIMDKDGANQRSLFPFDELYKWTDVNNVSWSPNSDALLAQIYIPGGSEIWKISVGGDNTRMSSIDDFSEHPKYSPDGLKVAFIIQGPNPPHGLPVYRLYSANTDFSDTLLIAKGWIQDYDWTTDSEEIVFSLFDTINQNSELWKSSFDGSGITRLSETLVNEITLSCSFDGNYITYSDYNGVYITPFDNFSPKLLLDSARLPEWIPNSNQILLYKLKTQGNTTWTEAWVIDTNGDVALKIEEGSASYVAFSSSGRYYTYTRENNIWLDKFPK